MNRWLVLTGREGQVIVPIDNINFVICETGYCMDKDADGPEAARLSGEPTTVIYMKGGMPIAVKESVETIVNRLNLAFQE